MANRPAEAADLAPAARARGQRAAILANLCLQVVQFIVAGGVMMLYASDVLGYQPRQIGALLGLLPLTVLLRFPLMKHMERFGLVRTCVTADSLRLGVLVLLIAIPAAVLRGNLVLYAALLVVFIGANMVGFAAAWQPLLREITTERDRGQFFGRMRTAFTLTTTLSLGAISLLIGDSIGEWQYKLLLLLAGFGLANRIFWVQRIPEVGAPATADTPGESGWRTWLRAIRPALRPALIAVLVWNANLAMMPVYLREVLQLPADYVAFYLFLHVTGMALSLMFWGRVADALGYVPLLSGLLLLNIVALLPLLLTRPLPPPPAFEGLAHLQLADFLTLAVVWGFGLLSGVLLAGMGIGNTNVMHASVQRHNAVAGLNLAQGAVMLFSALHHLLNGWLIDLAAASSIPRLHFSFFNGILRVDPFLIYTCAVLPLLLLVALLQVRKLPNLKPYTTVGDFFLIFSAAPIRTTVRQRHLYHDDEERREELARWLGWQNNPLGLDALLELLQDPAYDVRVEAVRALAQTASPAAGERLLTMLRDDRHEGLADHLVWALGELHHREAFDTVLAALREHRSRRVRAMAARALGKLGDERAVPQLVATLAEAEGSPMLLAACSRALSRLDAVQAAPQVCHALRQLTDRDEAYELLPILASWLELPTPWLLRATPGASIADALEDEVARRSQPWRDKRAATVAALREHDLARVQMLCREAATTVPADATLSHALLAEVTDLDRWHPLVVLAIAWLLYRD